MQRFRQPLKGFGLIELLGSMAVAGSLATAGVATTASLPAQMGGVNAAATVQPKAVASTSEPATSSQHPCAAGSHRVARTDACRSVQ